MPIDSVGSDPFSVPDQPANILSYDKGLLKSDETQTVCMVLESSISNEGAGEGLYTGFFFFFAVLVLVIFSIFFLITINLSFPDRNEFSRESYSREILGMRCFGSRFIHGRF